MKHTFLAGLAFVTLLAASCTPANSDADGSKAAAAAAQDKAERNKKVIMASVIGINNHDVNMVLKDAAPDVIEYGDGEGHPLKGLDSVKVMMRTWMNAFPDYRMDNVDYVAEGNKVVAMYDCSGTWKGDFMGMKPTGKSFKCKDVDIFTLNDAGKVTSHRSTQSMTGVMAMIGAPGSAPLAHNETKPANPTH